MLRTVVKSRVFTYGLVLITVYFGYNNVKALYFNLKYRLDLRALRSEIKVVNREKADVQEKLKATGTDEQIEKVARTVLGYVKKGEVAYHIVRK